MKKEFNESLLLTGCAGFIGSNFLNYIIHKYSDIQVIHLDALTYAANENYIRKFDNLDNYEFIKGKIQDREFVKKLFHNNKITKVVHFAAESHVDNSILNPDAFIDTNIHGTFVLIDEAMRSWMTAPKEYKKGYENARFLHISTDEVFGSLSDEGLFTEDSPYAPNSPYSASKAASDLLVRSYHKTYGLNTLITNCSNNYGPLQHDEKLIPTIIRSALNDKPIGIYGDGKNIRDWLFVTDHCNAIEMVLEHGEIGQTYNIGGDNEIENIKIAEKICALLDKKVPRENPYSDLITFIKDRAGHDRRYAIDSTKIKETLGWKAETSFEKGLDITIDWYLEKYIGRR